LVIGMSRYGGRSNRGRGGDRGRDRERSRYDREEESPRRSGGYNQNKCYICYKGNHIATNCRYKEVARELNAMAVHFDMTVEDARSLRDIFAKVKEEERAKREVETAAKYASVVAQGIAPVLEDFRKAMIAMTEKETPTKRKRAPRATVKRGPSKRKRIEEDSEEEEETLSSEEEENEDEADEEDTCARVSEKMVTDLANRMKTLEDPAKAMKELKEWVKNRGAKSEQWQDLTALAKILGVNDVGSRRNFRYAPVRDALLCF